MGVRLYLNTEDISALEQCAGVAAGTKARFDQFLLDTVDMDSYEAYCICQDLPDLSQWNNFQLFGFGKFSMVVPAGQSISHGIATGKEAVGLLLSSTNGGAYGEPMLVLELVEKYGVCWS